MCDRCREKYLREKQTAAREKVADVCEVIVLESPSVSSLFSPSTSIVISFSIYANTINIILKVKQSRKKPLQVKTPRALPTMEAHQVIRANALFLLSLSSAAEPSMLCHHPPRPLHSQLLPSLKEGVSEEPPNKMGCLYLQTLARSSQAHLIFRLAKKENPVMGVRIIFL